MKKIFLFLIFSTLVLSLNLHSASVTLYPSSVDLKFVEDTPQTFYLGINCQGFYDENSCFISSDSAGVSFDKTDLKCGDTVKVTLDPKFLFTDRVSVIVGCADNGSSSVDTMRINLDLIDYYNNYNYRGISANRLIWIGNVNNSLSDNESGFKAQKVYVKGFDKGWSAGTNVDWLSIRKGVEKDEETDEMKEFLEITPIPELFPKNSGYIYGYIEISDSVITTFVDVYILLYETNDDLLYKKTNFKIIKYYPNFLNKEVWNIDNMKRFFTIFNLVNYYDISEDYSNKKIYITVSLENNPNFIWAYNPSDPRIFIPVKINGVNTPDSDLAFYSKGKVDIIPFGPFTLAGLTGRFDIKVNVGDNFTDAENHNLIDFYLSIYGIKGKWQLYDIYEGQTYKHPNLLNIYTDTNGNVEGCFIDENNQCIKFLDVSLDSNYNYRLVFAYEDYIFEYMVEDLMETQLEGKWRWCQDNSCHDWEKFYGVKVLDLFNDVF